TTYDINDPYYSRNTLQDGYSNTFLTLGEYIPSFTNLSYILLLSDPCLGVTLEQNNTSTGSSYIKNTITYPNNPSQTKGNPTRFTYLQHPSTGTYTVHILSSLTKDFTLSGYLYDTGGNVQPFSLNGSAGSNNPDNFNL